MRAIVVLILLAVFSPALPAGEGEVEGFWQRTKKGVKRAAKGIKKAGKEVGRGTQEIFDPDDEDLQAERGEKKKKGKKEDAED